MIQYVRFFFFFSPKALMDGDEHKYLHKEVRLSSLSRFSL